MSTTKPVAETTKLDQTIRVFAMASENTSVDRNRTTGTSFSLIKQSRRSG